MCSYGKKLRTLFLNVGFVGYDSLQSRAEKDFLGSTLSLCPIIYQEEMGVVGVKRDGLPSLK